ncbi:MAG: VOC family protein [Nitrososphaerales archaeon]
MPRKKNAGGRRSEHPGPIPRGFRTITPYLTVTGGALALDFYKRAFGAKELSRHAMPDGKILNAHVKIGDSIVMLSDEFPGSATKSPTSMGSSTVTLHIYTKRVDRLWQRAVSAGAKVTMPLENQFWGERYGQLADPFGHRWSLSQRIKMNPEEMGVKQEAAMAMFSQSKHPGKSGST